MASIASSLAATAALQTSSLAQGRLHFCGVRSPGWILPPGGSQGRRSWGGHRWRRKRVWRASGRGLPFRDSGDPLDNDSGMIWGVGVTAMNAKIKKVKLWRSRRTKGTTTPGWSSGTGLIFGSWRATGGWTRPASWRSCGRCISR
jgi:hypothetical protein